MPNDEKPGFTRRQFLAASAPRPAQYTDPSRLSLLPNESQISLARTSTGGDSMPTRYPHE